MGQNRKTISNIHKQLNQMKAFLIFVSYSNPEMEGQMASGLALVHANTLDEAKEKINDLREKEGMERLPDENFQNATIL